MVARLVAVDISAQQAVGRDILVLGIVFLRQVHRKERVETCREGAVATHKVNQAADVVRSVEREVPRVALDEALAVGLQRVEVGLEAAVGVARAREALLAVEDVAVVERTRTVTLRRGLVAHIQSRTVYGPVVVRIFECRRGGRGAALQRYVTQPHIVGNTLVIGHRRGAKHGIQSRAHVCEVTRRNGIRKHRDGMIAAHAPVLVAHVAPDGKHVVYALVAMGDHRPHHVGVALREEEIEERVLGTVGIPQREDRIVGKALGVVDVMVHTAVRAVDVHIYRWVDHRMVERRVEHRALILRALDLKSAHIVVPRLARRRRNLVEAASRSLRTQIRHSALRTYGRERNLHNKLTLAARVETEVCRDLAPRNLGEVAIHIETAPETVIRHRCTILIAVVGNGLREGYGKIGIVGAGPAVGDAVTRNQSVALDTQRRPQDLAVVVIDAVRKVQNHMSVRILREGIAVHARTRGRRQLGTHAAVVERDGIVARRGALALMAETRTVSAVGIIRRARVELDIPYRRHHQNVAQIRMARAAEVRMAEAHDGLVAVAVARTILVGAFLILPAHVVGDGVGVGAELHRTEGDACPGEGVAHAVGADEGVDIVGRLLRRDCDKR